MAVSSSPQPESMGSIISNNLSLIALAALFFIGGFFVGSLWQENQMLKSGTGTTPTTATAPAADTGPTKEQLASLPLLKENDHIVGNKDAEVILIEYTDFECPFCALYHPTTKQLLTDYGDKLALVYRNYPLDFHPNAQKAGEAGECIAKLGGNEAYWKYANTIFETNTNEAGQHRITPDAITAAAQASGVNMTQYQTCLDSGEMADKVKTDMAEGSAAGVGGTPGTFIVTKDGVQEYVPGAYGVDKMKPILDKYIN